MGSLKYQTAVLVIVLAIFRPSVCESHYVDYLEDDAQRESPQEKVIAKSLQDLLDAEMDFPLHNPQRFLLNSLPSGSRLINPWQTHLGLPRNYIFTPLTSTASYYKGSEPSPRSLPKRKESPPDLKRYNKYFKKADSSDRKSRNSNYRQCFFNPISCFRK